MGERVSMAVLITVGCSVGTAGLSLGISSASNPETGVAWSLLPVVGDIVGLNGQLVIPSLNAQSALASDC